MGSQGDFNLNTKSMDSSAKGCQDLGDKMRSLKDLLNEHEADLLFYWEGKGRNEFEKQFRLLKGQMVDVTDTIFDTADKILNAEENYILADTQKAKELDGVTQGEIHRADDQLSEIGLSGSSGGNGGGGGGGSSW